MAGAIFANEGGLVCWRVLLLGSIVRRVRGINIVAKLKSGCEWEGLDG